MAKFERKDSKVTVAFLKCRRRGYARSFESLTAARAIKETGGWRIDRADAVAGTWTPWEPITRDVYQTRAKALSAIRQFERACRDTKRTSSRKRYGLGR